jgi:hypothetical protein
LLIVIAFAMCDEDEDVRVRGGGFYDSLLILGSSSGCDLDCASLTAIGNLNLTLATQSQSASR